MKDYDKTTFYNSSVTNYKMVNKILKELQYEEPVTMREFKKIGEK